MKNKIYDQIAEEIFLLFPLMRSTLFSHGAHKHGNESDSRMVHSKYHVMGILYKNGPMQMSEIGERIGLSKPNMTFIIDALISEGKVARSSDPKDRRLVMINITGKGKEDLNKAKECLKEELQKKISKLDSKEVTSLANSLKTIKTLVLKMKEGVSKQ